MANLSEQLESDMKTAMKAGDTRTRDVIRFLRSAVKNAEIERRRPLTDGEILDVIRGQIKQRRDSIELFARGGRDDLVHEEEAQIAVLVPYLPTQLDDEELESIVGRVTDELSATSSRDMGKVMQAVLIEVAGRAEGRRVSAAVKSELDARSGAASRPTT
jgi:uncharacterized protein YqeY